MSTNTAHIDSYYAGTRNDDTRYPALSGSHRADVAIVGGGFTGINCALELAERGYAVTLLEAKRIGWGASGRNGGQVTGSLSGDETLLRHLSAARGAGPAADYVWDLRWRGHGIIEERIARYGIDCDLAHGHLLTAWSAADMRGLNDILAEAEIRGMGADIALVSDSGLRAWLDTPLYHGALYNRRNMHLHSLNLCLGEARAAASLGVSIHEDSTVLEIEDGAKPVLVTAGGRVEADAVILAGNAYHALERPALAGRMFPAALGNLVTEPLDQETRNALNPRNVAVYDTRFVLDYYRLTGDGRLMFGGGANYSGKAPRNVAKDLRPALEATFPRLKGVKIDYEWSGMAGIVPNRVPMLGRSRAGVYYAQGYSGHGIATSHIVSRIMADAVGGTLEEFDAFAGVPHVRSPLGDVGGQALLALGMWYYRYRDRKG